MVKTISLFLENNSFYDIQKVSEAVTELNDITLQLQKEFGKFNLNSECNQDLNKNIERINTKENRVFNVA